MYVHRLYEVELGAPVSRAKRRLPDDFDYTVVKYNRKDGTVSFIRCSRFDEQPQPVIEDVVTIKQDGSVVHRDQSSDPFIYHHKWLFVRDDYEGFDVEESRERSRRIQELPNCIGKGSWESCCVRFLFGTSYFCSIT